MKLEVYVQKEYLEQYVENELEIDCLILNIHGFGHVQMKMTSTIGLDAQQNNGKSHQI